MEMNGCAELRCTYECKGTPGSSPPFALYQTVSEEETMSNRTQTQTYSRHTSFSIRAGANTGPRALNARIPIHGGCGTVNSSGKRRNRRDDKGSDANDIDEGGAEEMLWCTRIHADLEFIAQNTSSLASLPTNATRAAYMRI